MKLITVGEYLKLPISKQIEYNVFLSCQKPKEILKIKLDTLSYNEIKRCFKELKKDAPDVKFVFMVAFGLSEEEYFSIPIHKYFQIKKYLEEKFVFLYNREIQLLESVNANAGLWEIAGGNDLNEFSDVLPLSQLAKLYGGYPFDYGEKKYIEIIYLLRMNNKQGQVEAEYSKLISKQK